MFPTGQGKPPVARRPFFRLAVLRLRFGVTGLRPCPVVMLIRGATTAMAGDMRNVTSVTARLPSNNQPQLSPHLIAQEVHEWAN